jgi:hypothetical protein
VDGTIDRVTHERLVGDEADSPERSQPSLPVTLQAVSDDPDGLPPLMPPVFSPLPPEPSSSTSSE